MKKFNITKEQILEMQSWGNKTDSQKVKQWFPDAFEAELEVGKWYNIKNIASGSLGFCGIGQHTLDDSDSGLCNYQIGYNFREASGRIWRTNGNITESTEQEVKTALTDEAKNRGFNVGSHFKPVDCENIYESYKEIIFGFIKQENKLIFCNRLIFDNGKWATIVKTITKKEAEKALGKKIV